MLRKRRLGLLVVLLLLPGPRAGAGPGASPDPSTRKDFGRLNPQAPPQTAQFAFMIGAWDCKTKFMMPDGSGYNEGHATWTGYYILDGWAIQDDWASNPGGNTFRGTNIRSVDPETGKWICRWLPSGTLKWKAFEATREGDTMVMIGGEGADRAGDYVDRNVFYEITPDHWRWRKDRSHDGGKTWTEGIGYIEATRMSGEAD